MLTRDGFLLIRDCSMADKFSEFSGPVVSSAHLAAGAMPALSEFEFGAIMVSHAFERWMVRCMAAAGVPDMSPVDVLVLHTVYHRGKAKRMADICLVLNIEDTHVVSYAVKKLARLKLVTSRKQGKEKFISTTEAGAQACRAITRSARRCSYAPLAPWVSIRRHSRVLLPRCASSPAITTRPHELPPPSKTLPSAHRAAAWHVPRREAAPKAP